MAERPTPAPAVSVVVPLFNCLPLTQAMLASLDATWPVGVSREIILVDDGSTDGTRAWLATLEREEVRVVLNERNLGYAASNNRGVAVAKGEWLTLLNNDLVLGPNWLEPLLAAHARLGARAGVVGNVQYAVRGGALDHTGIQINAKGKPEHIRELSLSARVRSALRGWQHVDAVTGACMLVRRDLWIRLGGFDEGYRNGCEDVDLCLRAAAAGRFNGVALRSRVFHQVSSSPGRKQSDESNTLRLTLRWREQLVVLAARRWCEDFLAREWNHPNPENAAAAAAALFYVLRLRSSPPSFAIAGVQSAIDREIARWKSIGADASA